MKTEKRCFVFCPNPSVDILAKCGAIEAGTTNRLLEENRFPGGKGIHVALALAELDIPTTLVGIWGEMNGSALKSACKQYQPDLEILGPTVEGWNRSCYTFQAPGEWKDTELLGTGPQIDDRYVQYMLDIISDYQDVIHSIAVCGSWPSGAPATANQQIVQIGHELDIPVYIDCTGDQLIEAIKAKPYCIHLNRSEVTKHYKDNFDKAKVKLSKHCTLSAVTDGAKGLYLIDSTRTCHALVSVDNVVSTVGSGDCLIAGIIAGHYLEKSYEDIASLGAACGAANCMNEDLGMLLKSDVEALFQQSKSKLVVLE